MFAKLALSLALYFIITFADNAAGFFFQGLHNAQQKLKTHGRCEGIHLFFVFNFKKRLKSFKMNRVVRKPDYSVSKFTLFTVTEINRNFLRTLFWSPYMVIITQQL